VVNLTMTPTDQVVKERIDGPAEIAEARRAVVDRSGGLRVYVAVPAP